MQFHGRLKLVLQSLELFPMWHILWRSNFSKFYELQIGVNCLNWQVRFDASFGLHYQCYFITCLRRTCADGCNISSHFQRFICKILWVICVRYQIARGDARNIIQWVWQWRGACDMAHKSYSPVKLMCASHDPRNQRLIPKGSVDAFV